MDNVAIHAIPFIFDTIKRRMSSETKTHRYNPVRIIEKRVCRPSNQCKDKHHRKRLSLSGVWVICNISNALATAWLLNGSSVNSIHRSFYFSCSNDSKQWSVVSDVLCCFSVCYCLQQFACLLMFVVYMIFMLQFSSFLNLLFHLGSGRSSRIPALCHAPPAPPQQAQRGAKNEDETMKKKEIQRKNKIWKKGKNKITIEYAIKYSD